MRQSAAAGLLALVLIVLSIQDARAGSVRVTKAEDQAARIRLYEHEMKLRSLDPAHFDHKYPTLGKVLASEQGFDNFLAKHTFPRLLCVNTPFLWRVIAGDIFYHKLHPWQTTTADSGGAPTFPSGDPPGGSPAGGPGTTDPGGTGGTTVQVNSVPEPSSLVLLGSGLTLALVAATRRLIHKRLASARGL